MKLPKFSTFIGLVTGFSIAQAAPTSFVYEGILQDSAGVPINATSTLTLAIYDPSLACLLYEESQSVSPSSDGSFSLLVGSATGSAKRTGSDPSLTMDKVFAAGAVRSSGAGSCPSGYVAAVSDTRKLVISVNGIALNPAIDLTAAPFAINAEQSEKVGSYDPSKLLRSDGAMSVAALNDTKVSLLMSILDGTLSSPTNSGDIANKTYVDTQTSSKLNNSATFGGDVSGTYSAISVDKIKGYPVAAVAPANNDVLKWNGSSWTPSAVSLAITSTDVTTALGFSPIGPSQITTTGDANKILSLDGSAHASVYGLKLKGTTSGGVFLGSAAAGSAYSLTFPSSSPTSGQVLQADGSGNLSWTYPSAGVVSVSVTSPLANTGTGSAPVIGLEPGLDPFLKWNGVSWGYVKLNVTDLRSSINGSQQFPGSCTSSQSLIWNSLTDVFECINIKINNMASVTTAPITVYVRNDGSDSNCNGLADTAVGGGSCAFQTIQGALEAMPDIIRHNVNILVSTNLTNTSPQMAVIDKIVSAVDENGPSLTIAGHGSTPVVSNSYTGGSGFLIMSQARGVFIKNLNLNNFDNGTAIDNDGGIVFIEGTNLSNNRYGVKVSRSGMLMFAGTNSITISPSNADRATAISVSGQSRVSTEANLFISTSNFQNTRGIEVYEGEFAIENGKTVTLNDSSSGSLNLTGMEVAKSGSIQACDTCGLIFNMSNTNTMATALSVRGGNLSLSGNVQLNNIAGNGLVCDLGSSCQFYGALTVAGPSNGKPIQVKSHSSLGAYNNLTINSQRSAGGAGVDISEGSSFVFSPMQAPRQITFSTWSAGATAIRLNQSSSFSISSGYPASFNFNSIPTIFSASNGSHIDFSQTTLSGGPYNTGDIMLDETSNFKPGGNSFNSTKRLCLGGQTVIGSGPGSFCMETTSNGSNTYTNAINDCSSKNMKLCSISQYAQHCALLAGTLSTNWTVDMTDVTCSSGSFSSSSNSSFSTNHPYRCCR